MHFDARGQQGMGMLLRIMDSYFVQKHRFEVKNVKTMDLFCFFINMQLFISQYINWWTGVFLSAVWDSF